MDFIDYYKIKTKDINELEMILHSYENLLVFSTMDSKVAVIRIMSDINNREIIADILNSLSIELQKLENYEQH
jgi:K+/H+ antiporter YhaU regulatory subunit KhtT